MRRDVERLRELGYPVRARRGVAGGYRLEAGASLPPLLLDEGEAVAVAVGLRTAASAGVSGIEETSVRALAKLEQVLPDRVRTQVAAIGSATVPYPGSGPQVDGATLAAIAAACRDRERIRFAYRSGRRRAEPARGRAARPRPHRPALVPGRLGHGPHGLAHVPGGPYRGRRGSRRALRRAHAARAGPRRLRLARGLGRARPLPGPRAAARAAGRGRAARTGDGGTLEAVDEATTLLRTGSDWLGGLAVYVAEIGVDFTVLDPPEFAERVRRLAGRFARAV